MKLFAVAAWPVPTTVSEIRRFLGFSNYFRRFIDYYADGETPFYLNYGFHPLSSSGLLMPSAKDNEASKWLEVQEKALENARDCVRAAQVRQTRYPDRTRREVNYQPGEKVMVHRDYLQSPELREQLCNKLKYVWVGPFEVIKKISSNAVKLKLPSGCRSHSVINIAALKKYVENDMPGRVQPPPPPFVDLDGKERLIVEKILRSRSRRRLQEYLVKWVGYEEPTWEPASNLKDEAGRNIIPLQRFLSSAGN